MFWKLGRVHFCNIFIPLRLHLFHHNTVNRRTMNIAIFYSLNLYHKHTYATLECFQYLMSNLLRPSDLDPANCDLYPVTTDVQYFT